MRNLRGVRGSSAAVAALLSVTSVMVTPVSALRLTGLTPAPGYATETTTVSISGTPVRDALVTGLSSDGTRALVEALTGDGNSRQLVSVNLTADTTTVISSDGGCYAGPYAYSGALSADGTKLAYVDPNKDLFVRPTSLASPASPITSATDVSCAYSASNVALSADGSKVAYVEHIDVSEGNTKARLEVANTSGSPTPVLIEEINATSSYSMVGEIQNPVLSADGSRVAYALFTGGRWYLRVKSLSPTPSTVGADRPLTPVSAWGPNDPLPRRISMSADGATLAWVQLESIEVPPAYEFGFPTYRKLGHLYVAATTNSSPAEANPLGTDLDSTTGVDQRSGYADVSLSGDGTVLAFTAYTTDNTRTGAQAFRLTLPTTNTPGLIAQPALNSLQGTTAILSSSDGSTVALGSAWQEQNGFESIPKTALAISRPAGGLTKPSAAWAVPQYSGLAQLGDDVTISATTSESGVTLSASLALKRWSGLTLVDASVTVSLVKGVGDTYSGTYTLAENDARIVDASVTSTRGEETATKSAGQAAVDVGARFSATAVDLPDGESGYTAALSSPSGGGAIRQSLSDGTPFAISPIAAGDYDLGMFDSSGRPRRPASTVTLRAGKTHSMSLTASPLASLTVQVNGDGGDMTGTSVSLYQGSNHLVSGSTDATGLANFTGLPVGVSITIKTNGLPRLLSAADTSKSLTTGANNVAVSTTAPPRFALTGTVRRNNGRPAVGALVTVGQMTMVGYQSATAVTDNTGAYSVEILDGRIGGRAEFKDVDWSVSYSNVNEGRQFDLRASGPSIGDFTMQQTAAFPILVKVTNQGSNVPLRISNWAVKKHLYPWATLNGDPFYVSDFSVPPSGISGSFAYIYAKAGDTYRLCFDGYEAGFGQACGTVVLADVDTYQTLNIVLPVQKAFTVNLFDGTRPFTGDTWWQLFEISGSTRVLRNSSSATPDSKGKLVISDPAIVAGKKYSVTITSANGNATISTPVLGSPNRISLGSVRLQSSAWFNADGTSLTADRSLVGLGGRVRMRAELRPTTNLAAPILTIPLTTGITYVASSLTLNGAPIPVGRILVGASAVTVTMDPLIAQQTSVITYDLAVATSYPGETLPASISMQFTPEFQLRTSESIYASEVEVAAMTIAAPSTTTSRSIEVAGTAAPLASVTVTEGSGIIGRTTADDAGRWTLGVSLADRGTIASYVLRASTGGSPSVSAYVNYDEHFPAITRVCMAPIAAGTEADADTTDYCYDPRVGAVSFPFIFKPGSPTRVRFTVDHPDRVDAIQVLLGEASGTATKQVGKFANTFLVDLVADGSGDLYAKVIGRRSPVPVPTAYLTGLAAAVNPDATATPEEIEAAEAISRTRFTSPAITVLTKTASVFSAQISAQPIDPKDNRSPLTDPALTNTLTLTKDVNYTLTAADVEQANRSGLAVYGFKTEIIALANGLSKRRTVAYIDASTVPGLSAPLRFRPRGGIGSVVKVVGVALENLGTRAALGAAFTGATSVESGNSAFDEGEKWDRIAAAQNRLGGCLTPQQIRDLNSRAETVGYIIAAGDVANTAINIAGVFLAPETFGVGAVAAWAIGWGLGKVVDWVVDTQTELMEQEVDTALRGCESKPPRPMIPNPNWRRGEPKWIFDPSGYAYEGSPEFRVPGVTATLLNGPSLSATDWAVFDMVPYGQVNPLVTNNEGRYAWNVPEGFWKVQFTKDGFLPAFSDAVEVLPPQFEVHGSMVRATAPVVDSRSNDGRGLIVNFDQPMRVASVTAASEVRQTNGGGAIVSGTWEPVVSGTDVNDGALLAKSMRFVPDAGIAPNTTYWVRIGTEAADHTGRPMASASTGTVTTPSAALVPLAMNRLVDTRKGKAQLTATKKAKLGANKVLVLSVSGVGGVPASSVGAVSLLVSVAGPGKAGALTVYPCDGARPNAPSVNFSKGQTLPGAVIARLSASGTVCIHSSSATDVLVDIDGYFPTGGGVTALSPVRLMDTRTAKTTPRTVDDQFWKTGTRSSGSETRLTVSGRGGLASTARAVILRLTVSGSKKAGTITAYPCGSTRPETPNVVFGKGQTVSALAFVTPGNTAENEGEVCIHTSQAAHVAVDALGFADPTALVDISSPAKLLDTLPASTTTVDGSDWKLGRRAANSVYQLTVAGRGGVPTNAAAALITLTASGSTAAGTLTAYPCGTTRPAAAQVVYGKNQSLTASVIVPLGTGPNAGKVCLFTTKPVHLRVEAVGAAPTP